MKTYKLITALFIVGLALFLNLPAKAALISVNNANQLVSVGDVVIFPVIINTEGRNINVVEGEINIVSGQENFLIKELSVAGSNFSLWPVKPSFSESMKKITFTAGIPGGVNRKDAVLFKIIIQAQGEGQVVFAPSNIKAYINDGRATPVETRIDPMNFQISSMKDIGGKNDLGAIIIGDHKKPWGLVAEIGRDSSLFDGKSFVFFSAFDNESGIDRFEVKEGDRNPVRSGSIYVFQNQQRLEPTMIVAYDKAGNSRKIWLREKTYWERNNMVAASFYAIAGLLLFVAIVRIILAFKSFYRKQ